MRRVAIVSLMLALTAWYVQAHPPADLAAGRGMLRAVPMGRTCRPESSGRREAPVSSMRGRGAGRLISDEYSGSTEGTERGPRAGRSYSIDMS